MTAVPKLPVRKEITVGWAGSRANSAWDDGPEPKTSTWALAFPAEWFTR